MKDDFIRVEEKDGMLKIVGKITVKAEGEIPFGIVVPAETEGKVKALPDDEPLFIDGKLNPKVIGRVVDTDTDSDSVLIELWHS